MVHMIVSPLRIRDADEMVFMSGGPIASLRDFLGLRAAEGGGLVRARLPFTGESALLVLWLPVDPQKDLGSSGRDVGVYLSFTG
jgi:hypothetical protein